MTKLIMGCGVGRCGTGFLSFFMFLNPKIAVWDGPGMGEMVSHVEGKEGLSLKDLHDVWGNDYHEPTHTRGSDKWKGFDDFATYYTKRITERRKSDLFFISHVMGEQWYPLYRDHFKCDIVAVYCAREIVSHYRSFKRWYHIDGFTPEAFLDRIKGSLDQMKVMLDDKVPVLAINTPDYSMPDVRKKMRTVMNKIGIKLSKEQTAFLKIRRKLGPSKAPLDQTDAELLAELKQVDDFQTLKRQYDNLRKRYEA